MQIKEKEKNITLDWDRISKVKNPIEFDTYFSLPIRDDAVPKPLDQMYDEVSCKDDVAKITNIPV